jgi:hypothetical protein
MGRDEADHQLLSSTDNDYTYDDLNSYDADEKKFAPQSSSRNTIRYLMAALSISSILNCALLVAYHLAKSQIHLCPSEYSKLLASDFSRFVRLTSPSWAWFDYKGNILAKHRLY